MTAVPSLALAPRFELRVSPALLAFSEVLALPLAELEKLVAQELDANPALERVEQPACGDCGLPLTGGGCVGCDGRLDRRRPRPADAESGDPATPEPPHRPSAVEQFMAEVAPLVPTRDRWLAAFLVADLDDRGFLGRDARAIAAELAVDASRVAGVIDAIRAVGPPGICAVDLGDCLLRQLELLEAGGEPPKLLRSIIVDHLDDLGRGRIGAVATALRADRAEVLASRDFLRRHLHPYATLPEPAELPAPPPPDVIIRHEPGDTGRFQVEVVGTATCGIRLDPAWLRLTAQARRRPWLLQGPELQRLLAGTTKARAFLDRLVKRSDVLRRVAAHVAERQRGYLRHGPAAHIPLTRAQVAEALDLHESTVSRAVADKVLRLPDGRVVPFAELFGSACSAQDSLAAIVSGEDRPMTDGELAAELHARGHAVARRTVAKYRGQLGIPPRACR
jgi:RNA polymerase sigma-54 factor